MSLIQIKSESKREHSKKRVFNVDIFYKRTARINK